MRIRFIQYHIVKQGDGKGPVYKVGEVVDFKGPIAETYAQAYISRGYAVDTANDPKPEPKPEPKSEPKPAAVAPAPQQAEPDLAASQPSRISQRK